jgi:hypothetical protein
MATKIKRDGEMVGWKGIRDIDGKSVTREFPSGLEAERWEKGGDEALAALPDDLARAKEREKSNGPVTSAPIEPKPQAAPKPAVTAAKPAQAASRTGAASPTGHRTLAQADLPPANPMVGRTEPTDPRNPRNVRREP